MVVQILASFDKETARNPGSIKPLRKNFRLIRWAIISWRHQTTDWPENFGSPKQRKDFKCIGKSGEIHNRIDGILEASKRERRDSRER